MSKNELDKNQPNLTQPKSIDFFILKDNPTLPNPIWPDQTQSNFWFWEQDSTLPKNQFHMGSLSNSFGLNLIFTHFEADLNQ